MPYYSRTDNLKNFDWEIYLLNYPDLVDLKTRQDACLHYTHIGQYENRSDEIPNNFDAERYLKTYSHLWLKTERDAYIHFMKMGASYEQDNANINPLRLLISSEYQKIVEHNNQLLWEAPNHIEPFVLPPRPKAPTVSEPRPPQIPSVLKPPKGPPKNPRSTQPIVERRIPPKIVTKIEVIKPLKPTDTKTTFLVPKKLARKPVEPELKKISIQTVKRLSPTPTSMLVPKSRRVRPELKRIFVETVKRQAQPPVQLLPPKQLRRVIQEEESTTNDTPIRQVALKRSPQPPLQLLAPKQPRSKEQMVLQSPPPAKEKVILTVPSRPAQIPSQLLPPKLSRKVSIMEPPKKQDIEVKKRQPQPPSSLLPLRQLRSPRGFAISTKNPTPKMSSANHHFQPSHVREPKPDEIFIKEPPSVYFQRMGKKINPPVYLN